MLVTGTEHFRAMTWQLVRTKFGERIAHLVARVRPLVLGESVEAKRWEIHRAVVEGRREGAATLGAGAR